MARTFKLLFGLFGGLVVCASVRGAEPAAPAGNPYQSIVERNVFHLNPPPAPPDPEANKPPPPKIFLTGITTLMGNRRALLKTTPPAKPGEPPKEKSYMLAEHERLDDLEVVAIDEVAGSVKVTYGGMEFTVNFKDNGAASVAQPAGPPPGTPGVPGAPAAPAGFFPGMAQPGMAQPGVNPAFKQQFPPRPVRGGEMVPVPGQVPSPGQPAAADRSVIEASAALV